MNNHDRLRQSATWLTASRVWWAVALSVAIAVGVVVVSAIQGASWSELRAVEVDWGWLVVAMSLVVLRDLGYILRLMVLGRGSLNAGKATSSIALWELASALTPSVVGGSAVASFILHRNGLTWGRSLAVVMTTALLDESFFLLAVPATALIAGWGPFFPEGALGFKDPWPRCSQGLRLHDGACLVPEHRLVLGPASGPKHPEMDD